MPTTLFNTEARHLVLLGDAADRLAPVARYIRDVGGVVSRHVSPRAGLHCTKQPITCAILAETFDTEVGEKPWWHHADELEHTIEALLSSMANPSTILLVAFGRSERRKDRRAVRDALRHIVAQFHSHAAAGFAIDLTVNAVEVPPDADPDLLLRRLAGFARHRSAACSDSVLSYEEIEDAPIRSALANLEL